MSALLTCTTYSQCHVNWELQILLESTYQPPFRFRRCYLSLVLVSRQRQQIEDLDWHRIVAVRPPCCNVAIALARFDGALLRV